MRRRVEAYICIGKCVPTSRVSLARSASRSLSLSLFPTDRTSFTRRGVSPALPRALLYVPHLRSFIPLVPARGCSLVVVPPIPRSLFHPRAAAARCRSLSLATCLRSLVARALFSPGASFFSQYALGPSSDFYNLLLVAPHTTDRRWCVRHGPPGKTGK